MANCVKINLENILQEINKQYINIDKYRAEYSDNFSEMRNILFKKLRELQPFGCLFNGFQLGGSYGDNLKVTKPNEFDLVFHIRFPYNQLIIVHADDYLAGNVQLNMKTVLHRISKEKQNAILYNHLQKWVDDEDYLIIDKLQGYFVSCFYKVLISMNNKVLINDVEVTLKYRRQGPAHTIYINGDSDGLKPLAYSIDFVPGILLDKSQSVLPLVQGQWEAIPKPIFKYGVSNEFYDASSTSRSKLLSSSSTSFRASYYREEQNLIKDMQNLKNALRMLKKFRDTHSNMQKMKSYFIKTLFLWKIKTQSDDNYWRSPLYTILIDMFEEMEKSLSAGVLKFYWHPSLNLYQNYSENLLIDMAKCVGSARKTLVKANGGLILQPDIPKCVWRIFLRADEYGSRRTRCRFPPIRECNENVDEGQDVKKEESNATCIII